MPFVLGSASPEHPATHTMRSTHVLDRRVTGTASKVEHRHCRARPAQQGATLWHARTHPLQRLSLTWIDPNSSAQHRLAIADARGARGLMSQRWRAHRLFSPRGFVPFMLLQRARSAGRLDSCTRTRCPRAGIESASVGPAAHGRKRYKTHFQRRARKSRIYTQW